MTSHRGRESEARGHRLDLGSEAPHARAELALAIVTVASVATGGLVFLELARDLPMLGRDEPMHVLQGALIAHDLREGDLPALAFDTYRQVYWPPLHSWLVAAAFLVAGPGLEAARAVSVLALVLLAPVLFLLARALEPRHGIVAGSVAAGLALSSPGNLVFAAKGMLELPGLLAIGGTMLLYTALERDRGVRSRAHAFLGLAVVVTYLIKSNYGILLGLAIVLDQLIAVRFRVRRLKTAKNLYALFPVILFCIVWFAYPKKLVWTWNALVNRPWGGEEVRGLAGLAYFPLVIVDYAGSAWMAVLFVASLAFAMWRRRDRPGVRVVALVALLLFVIGEIHHTKHARHILPVFPSLCALTGVAAAALWGRLRVRARGSAAALALLACLGVFHVAALAERRWIPPEPRHGEAVLEFAAAQVQEHPPALVMVAGDAWPPPPVVDLHLVSEGLLPATAAGSAMNPREERELAQALDDPPLPRGFRRGLQRVLGRYDAPARVRTLHPGDRNPESRAQFAGVVAVALERDPPRTILALIGSADTTRVDAAFVGFGPVGAGYRQVETREFPRAGTRVLVYRLP